jgi:hypothetical protein
MDQKMTEEDSSNVTSIEPRVINHFKKNEIHKENSLYPDPTPKCYIGSGNNSEL